MTRLLPLKGGYLKTSIHYFSDRAIRRSPYGAAGTAEGKRQPSPVSTPVASPKAALHAYAAEGGGSFAAPTGRALSIEAQGREDTFIPVWGHQTLQSLFVEHLATMKDRELACV